MILLLPENEDGLPELEARLAPESLDLWLAGLSSQEVDVYLPRFNFTADFELADVLSAMGMPFAFDGRADFSGMNGTGGIWISRVVHKAFVLVNEEGTEAAAATGVVMTDSAPERAVFRADHPFLFFIRDNVSGAFCFWGG